MNKLRSLILGLLAFATCAGGFPISDYQALDNNGDPCNGCKLYTYSVGTTANKATYSDDALSSANANPIVADSAGRMGRIYLLEDECYKFVLKSSDDATTYYTVDDVCGEILSNTAISTRITQIASNPIDQGAAGDGTTDDTTEVQAAIDAATGVVDLVGKTYRVSSALTLPSNIIFRNGTLDFSQDSSGELHVVGTIASTVALDTNATAGSTQIDVGSVSGLSAGDLLFIKSSDQYSSNSDISELVEIETVNAGTVDISTELLFTYNTADTATTQLLTPKENVVLEDLRIITSTTTGGSSIKIQYARDITVRNVKVTDVEDAGIRISMGYNVWLTGATIYSSQNNNDTGVVIDQGSRNVWLRDVNIRGTEYGVVLDGAWFLGGQEGVVTNTVIRDCVLSNNKSSAIKLAGSFNTVISGNTIDGGASGLTLAGIRADDYNVSIVGNKITGFSNEGIRMVPDGDLGGEGATISGNYVDGADTGASGDELIEISTGASGTYRRLLIFGNTLVNAYATAINISFSSEVFESVKIAANYIEVDGSAAGTGIFANVKTSEKLAIDQNHIKIAAASTGIDTGNSSKYVSLRSNSIELVSGGKGISATVGSHTGAAGPMNIALNTIVDIAGTGTYGIEVDYSDTEGVHGLTLEANVVLDTPNPVEIRGYVDDLLFNGNHLDDSDTSNNVLNIAGDLAGAIQDIMIDSNHFDDGGYSIGMSNTTGTKQEGTNAFIGFNTAATTGDAFDDVVFTVNLDSPNLATVMTTLSNSDVKNLAATPITLVSGETGKIHIPTEILCQLNYGGTNVFTAGAGDDLDVRYTNGSGTVLLTELETSTWLVASTDRFARAQAVDLVGTTSHTDGSGAAIVLNNNGAEIAGNAANDNTMTCWLTYRTFTVQ